MAGWIDDQYKFLHRALTHPVKLMRKKAFEQISNENLLLKFIMKSNDRDLKKMAFNKIKDELLLKQLAIGCMDPDLRRYAVVELKTPDDSLFSYLVNEDNDFLVRREALEKIRDKRTIEKLVPKISEPSLKKIALAKISDQYFLRRIAVNDPNPKIRLYALRCLKQCDSYYLYQRALNDADFYVRELACRLIRNDALLCDLVLKTSDMLLAQQAILKINNVELLAYLRMLAPSHLQALISKRISQVK